MAERKNRKCWVRYYISSADLTAEKFANAMRSHWDVENKLYWRLDVAMNEDDCRIRRGNAAELFSGIRHIAVNVLTENKEFKAGLRRKMRRAAMDREYLVSVLAGRGFVIFPWCYPRANGTSTVSYYYGSTKGVTVVVTGVGK